MSEPKYETSWLAKDCMGKTALHYLVQTDPSGEVVNWVLEQEETIEIDLNAMTNGGLTPMMLAVKLNHEKVVELLLNNSANPFLKDQLGQEAIDYKISFTRHRAGQEYEITDLLPIEISINRAKDQWKEKVDEATIYA